MRFQGLKLIAIAKAIKIILEDTVLLFLLRSFILGSQCTLQIPSWALSTNAASLTKVCTFNATHLSYSFDFFSRPFLHSISSKAYIQFFYSWTLCNKNPDFCPYLLASHPPCPLQTLHRCPLTSAALWASLLPFADASEHHSFHVLFHQTIEPLPLLQMLAVPAALAKEILSTPMGKSRCPLLRTSKFPCVVEAPRCSVSGSYSNCIQVKTPARAPLPPSPSPPLLSLQLFLVAGGEWKGW